jgi:hypothetical protein
VPHARALARLASAEGEGVGVGVACRAERAVRCGAGVDSLMVNVTVGCQWALNHDNYQ